MKFIGYPLVLLLEYVEGHETQGPYKVPMFDDHTSEQVQYHIRICEEADWLHSGNNLTCSPHPKYTHMGELT